MRSDQIAVFREQGIRQFEDKMVSHVQQFFPEQYEKMGEQEVRLFVRDGVAHAAEYEIVGQLDVCMFIDLMVAFGADFDHNSELPWVREILNNPQIESPSDKVEQLCEVGLSRLAGRSID